MDSFLFIYPSIHPSFHSSIHLSIYQYLFPSIAWYYQTRFQCFYIYIALNLTLTQTLKSDHAHLVGEEIKAQSTLHQFIESTRMVIQALAHVTLEALSQSLCPQLLFCKGQRQRSSFALRILECNERGSHTNHH